MSSSAHDQPTSRDPLTSRAIFPLPPEGRAAQLRAKIARLRGRRIRRISASRQARHALHQGVHGAKGADATSTSMLIGCPFGESAKIAKNNQGHLNKDPRKCDYVETCFPVYPSLV